MHISIITGSNQRAVRIKRNPFTLLGAGLLSLLLASCAVQPTEPQWDPLQTPSPQAETGRQPGLSRADSRLSPAMADLLQRADTAIEQQQWSSASGLLERALRINPRQAQAWSRMAVVKLGTGNPQQGLQMAKKSNRYAQEDEQLMAYNWLLMSRAHQQLGQAQQAQQALQRSRQLQGAIE
jgi:tetratricopeptide (TPR) repeat protein